MPFDQELMATSATTRGPVSLSTGVTNGPTIDLKSNDRVQNLEATLRVSSMSGDTARMFYYFQESTEGTTWTNMPGALVGTTGNLLGFPVVTTSDRGSTDDVASGAPQRITIRATKRYIRGVASLNGTTPVFAFSVTLEPVGGAKQGGRDN